MAVVLVWFLLMATLFRQDKVFLDGLLAAYTKVYFQVLYSLEIPLCMIMLQYIQLG